MNPRGFHSFAFPRPHNNTHLPLPCPLYAHSYRLVIRGAVMCALNGRGVTSPPRPFVPPLPLPGHYFIPLV